MSEDVNDIGKMDDPASYKEAIKSKKITKMAWGYGGGA
jgi:hypothetical protein